MNGRPPSTLPTSRYAIAWWNKEFSSFGGQYCMANKGSSHRVKQDILNQTQQQTTTNAKVKYTEKTNETIQVSQGLPTKGQQERYAYIGG
jgi:hypothetical protein